MLKIAKNISICLIVAFFAFSSCQAVFAYSFNENSGIKNSAPGLGYDTSEEKSGETGVLEIIRKITNAALSVLGIVFFGLAFYGGWLWMTAQEHEDQVINAKRTIQNGTIGLIVVLGAYAVSYFILKAFEK